MADGVHALMQDADDGDTVTGRPKIDDVLLDIAPPIARPNMGTALRPLRRIGQIGAPWESLQRCTLRN